MGGARRPCSLQSSQPVLSSHAESLAWQVVLGAVLSLTSPLIMSVSSGALVYTAPTFLPKCFLVIMVDLPAILNNAGAMYCLLSLSFQKLVQKSGLLQIHDTQHLTDFASSSLPLC